MYKIAVLGDRTSVLGFMALGLDVFPEDTAESARKRLHELAKSDYAIIYITEQLAEKLSADIERYKARLIPAVILIPGTEGTKGIGQGALQSAVEKAVGANIL